MQFTWPVLDRLIVMDHGDSFWHGHPQPLACPEGRFRASVSAYYYVAAPSADEEQSWPVRSGQF